MARAKAKHLPESELRRLEQLDGEALAAELQLLSPKMLTEQFRQLLVAYRLAAHVANRAFGYAKDPSAMTEEALLEALHEYAPEHFADPHDPER